MPQTKRSRLSSASTASFRSDEGPRNSGQTDQTGSTQSGNAIISGKRKIHLNTRILGNDALHSPDCFVSDSLCDLCFLFLMSSLDERTLSHRNSRYRLMPCGAGNARRVFMHYSSRRMLKHSVEAGCELCSRILGFSQANENDRIVLALS